MGHCVEVMNNNRYLDGKSICNRTLSRGDEPQQVHRVKLFDMGRCVEVMNHNRYLDSKSICNRTLCRGDEPQQDIG